MDKSIINVDLQPVAEVVNKAIDKISDAVGWVVNYETPQKIAQKSFIDDVQKSNLSPIYKSVLIGNSKRIIKEYQNQEKIIEIALTNLNADAKPQNVENDWLSEFMDKARHISDSDYQYIWGKILAGEMDNPGSFSIGAIDRLRCLSKKDAICLQKASQIALKADGVYYILANTKEKSGLDNYDFSFLDILQLSDCGMMRSEVLNFEMDLEKNNSSSMYNDSIIVFYNSTDNICKKAILRVFTFTESGNQLLNILETEKKNEQIINELKYLKNNQKGLDIEVFKINSIKENKIEYSTQDLLK